MISCQRCSKPAIVHQRYSGLHLCGDHFQEDVERKVRETLRSYGIFGQGGLLAVAMSGGKDSSTLLYILSKIFSKRRDISMVALLVDEGLKGYRETTLTKARKLADRLGIHHQTLRFEEAFSITVDEIVDCDPREAPCSYCAVLRKTLLNRASREIGAMALATGHNLDDEAQTILLNYLRGDTERLFRLRPPIPRQNMVPRIKPLTRVPEKEVALYAMINELFPYEIGSCPNVPKAMRLEVKELLNQIEDRHPGTKYSLLKGFEGLMELRPTGSEFQVKPCSLCGEPTGNNLCQSCKLLAQIKGKAFKTS